MCALARAFTQTRNMCASCVVRSYSSTCFINRASVDLTSASVGVCVFVSPHIASISVVVTRRACALACVFNVVTRTSPPSDERKAYITHAIVRTRLFCPRQVVGHPARAGTRLAYLIRTPYKPPLDHKLWPQLTDGCVRVYTRWISARSIAIICQPNANDSECHIIQISHTRNHITCRRRR